MLAQITVSAPRLWHGRLARGSPHEARRRGNTQAQDARATRSSLALRNATSERRRKRPVVFTSRAYLGHCAFIGLFILGHSRRK